MLRKQGHATDSRAALAQPSALEEARLIERIVGQDLRAFEALYRIYHPRLTRFLTNMLRRPHLVEEALDDALLVVWRRPEGYDGTSKVSTWIFGIAYRTALKALARYDEPQEDKDAMLRISADASPEQQLEQRQTHEQLVSAMSRLSTDHRTVLDLTYFHQIGYREIALIMDCPLGTVKTRMHHARLHLRQAMAGQLQDWL